MRRSLILICSMALASLFASAFLGYHINCLRGGRNNANIKQINQIVSKTEPICTDAIKQPSVDIIDTGILVKTKPKILNPKPKTKEIQKANNNDEGRFEVLKKGIISLNPINI